ncbi:MAG: sodium:calcium antiporter [bacterium]|nr:sodium:calcium antiporter [bacterium]
MIIRFKWFWIVGFLTVPWIAMRMLGIPVEPLVKTILAGFTIMAAAFLLTWAAEAAEHDFSGSLVLALLALITVSPEYAVDGTLVWYAGKDSSFAQYAIANMTGANRLLVGLGWATVIYIFFWKTRGNKKSVSIPKIQRIDCGILAVATLYAFFIAWRGNLAWFDAVVLVGLFCVYLYKIAGQPSVAIEVVGPAKAIVAIRTKTGRMLCAGFCMGYAAFAIYCSAEPFTKGLIEMGKIWGIGGFLLMQWLAPLASESPEFIVAILFALRMHPQKGLGLLVASKVNQWTLLVGTIPVIFMISQWSGIWNVAPFRLDAHQAQEIALTAAQSLLAVVLLANLNLSLWEAGLLVGLFLAQLLLPSYHGVFIGIYLFAATAFLIGRRRESLRAWRAIAKELLPKKK